MRFHNKSYWRIPGGEVQHGHISGRWTIWWRGRRLWPRNKNQRGPWEFN